MKLVLESVRQSGYYIHPAERGRIYGWDIRTDQGHHIAVMTADDLDLDEKRAMAEKLVRAFNACAE